MPKRRASLRRTTVPSSRVKTTWSCFASAPFASPAMIRPDMPRCSSNSPVSSSSIRMYLPRRARAPISAPSSRSASIGGNGRRRSGRRNSAWTMRRPLMRSAGLNPRPGARLVDVAGATGGIACRALPRLTPAAGGQVIVCDATFEMLETGRARAIDDGILAGIEWLCGDAELLPLADRSADLYTIAFGLRNVTRIERALAEARRVLKPGGRFLCLEFTPAVTPLLQPLYDLYSFQFLPWLGQILTGNRDAYTYLVESIRRFPAQSELSELIAAAGLERVKFRNLTGGIAALHSAWRL